MAVTGGRRVLFVEGTSDDSNGDLKQGFNKLLSQKLKGNMPRIDMGNSTGETLRKLKHCKKDVSAVALIDLDGDEQERDKRLKNIENEYGIGDNSRIYFMIQEMEAWFLSQPEILDEFYGENISAKIPVKSAKQFNNPDKVLENLTEKTRRGKYHKVRHGVQLLKRLDANKLQEYFSDFGELVKRLDCR
ncbi:uncharacterized protein DUF4276 [Anaerobacterium chartisolvens]|uniref:Uncharacterized protein DUF4276 n=1 Tax=Anaerobacterium chartisolvens TaxID=1297424 RepID=A0A369AHT1_9FIRM|nr:DUF4276 family protein [Anaerobacterium chartisolvens]RCX08910.1 uncharacterized protein DUF4276 [Anaerobacterium chartisolvens]